MSDTSDQWAALESENERLVDPTIGPLPVTPATPVPPVAGPAAPDARPSAPDARPAAPPGRRPGRHRQRAVAAASAAALAVAGAAAWPASAAVSPDQSPAPASWQTVLSVGAPGDPAFTAVTATGRHRAWAFQSPDGPSAVPAWRLTSAGWSLAPSPGKDGHAVAAAGASSARDVWAFTEQGAGSRAFRWDGTRWVAAGSFTRDVGATVVLSSRDVWAFGAPNSARGGLGARHYDGHRWKRLRSGRGLNSGSALSAHSIWAVGGKTIAHWNGHQWSRTSVAAIIPPDTQFCRPTVTAIYARSSRSVWAVGAGNCEDEIGPGFLLHYDGHQWGRVAHASFGAPVGVVPDGSGGLWIPSYTGSGGPVHMVHYSGGSGGLLRNAQMPVGARRLRLLGIATAPGTPTAFAVGATFRRSMPGVDQAAVVFEFRN